MIDHRFRLMELLAALSVATDVGMGQPPETALRSCLLATARTLTSISQRPGAGMTADSR